MTPAKSLYRFCINQVNRIRKQNREIRAEKDLAMKAIRIQMRDISKELLKDAKQQLVKLGAQKATESLGLK